MQSDTIFTFICQIKIKHSGKQLDVLHLT